MQRVEASNSGFNPDRSSNLRSSLGLVKDGVESTIRNKLFHVCKEYQTTTEVKKSEVLKAEAEWVIDVARGVDANIDPQAVFESARRIDVYPVKEQ